MSHLISVIVPVYNVESYLPKCIESIMNQTYKNLQILLIDDGSTDQSGYICEKYAQADNRIEVVHKENEGPASARKVGIALARGEYIGFVDADDYIDLSYYQELLDDIIENDVDFVNGGYIIENDGLETMCNQYETGIYELTGKQAEFIKTYMLKPDSDLHMSFGVWCKLFKADLVRRGDAIVPASQRRGEDKLLVFSCILNSKRIYLDKRAGYHYVMRSSSITHCHHAESIMDYGTLYRCLVDLFDAHGILEVVRDELAVHFKDLLLDLFSQGAGRMLIPRYEFAAIDDIKGKRVVLYGAGNIGQNYYAHICKYNDITIVAWADKNYKKFHYNYREVISKNEIMNYEFDLLIVALLDKVRAELVKKELLDSGIPESKIIWKKPSKILDIEI